MDTLKRYRKIIYDVLQSYVDIEYANADITLPARFSSGDLGLGHR